MATNKRIGILGLGYVGLANAAVLAEEGYSIVAYDVDKEKISMLREDPSFIFEKELSASLIKKRKRIIYTDNIADLHSISVFLLTLPTPSYEDGSCDTSALDVAIEKLAEIIGPDAKASFVIRSTVRVGYADELRGNHAVSHPLYSFISMPEFLAEGRAYIDEKNPSRIVVGAKDEADFRLARELVKGAVSRGAPLYEMSNKSAELSKYASNAFLATKISYINSLARLAEAVGANIKDVSAAMGADPRIGHSMLNAGIGYGGPCLRKDVAALEEMGSRAGLPLSVVEETKRVNESQPLYVISLMQKHLGSLKEKTIALLGLGYKAGVSDTRSSMSFDIAKQLSDVEGAYICGFDFSEEARKNFADAFGNKACADKLEDALRDADAVMILTADRGFKVIKEKRFLSLLREKNVFDFQNLFSLSDFPSCLYVSIGRAAVSLQK